MSFEIVERGEFRAIEQLPLGQASIGKRGGLLVRREELAKVGVSDKVLILADAGTIRLALRPPAGKAEVANAYPVGSTGRRGKGKRSATARIHIGKAIKELDLQAATVAGRYRVKVKKNLLIIDLGQAVATSSAARKAVYDRRQVAAGEE